ncbi:hypothetical protein [Aquabacterium sp.]|uniref:hypothetical protein n=1 Tax=Aquabacterium sp. TaxID=1872578 RepID=UPI004037BF3E
MRGYSHVAICLSGNRILEASSSVKISTVADLLVTYDHIAVLRDERLWGADQLVLLEEFAHAHVGKPFNFRGMKRLPEKKKMHADSVMQEIEDYFAGKKMPRVMDSFFCSQLIAESFIHAGIIHESAAVPLAPVTTSPKTISEDLIYGQFVGYLRLRDGYILPPDDRFRRAWPPD